MKAKAKSGAKAKATKSTKAKKSGTKTKKSPAKKGMRGLKTTGAYKFSVGDACYVAKNTTENYDGKKAKVIDRYKDENGNNYELEIDGKAIGTPFLEEALTKTYRKKKATPVKAKATTRKPAKAKGRGRVVESVDAHDVKKHNRKISVAEAKRRKEFGKVGKYAKKAFEKTGISVTEFTKKYYAANKKKAILVEDYFSEKY